MTLYDRIRLRREELGMSQEDLANKLGYKSRSTINKIELGINDITQSKIAAFAKALDVTPAWLMGWEEKSNRNVRPEIKENIVIFSRNGEIIKKKFTEEEMNIISTMLDSLKGVQDNEDL